MRLDAPGFAVPDPENRNMQNRQDFHLPIAILTMGKEILPGSLCAPRELVTISQNCRRNPTVIQEKTLRKPIVRSSVRGVNWRTERAKKVVLREGIGQ
jgi:hypothetical protein